MNNNLMYLAMFAAGAAVGSVATWKYVKDKYEKIAQEEIDSMRDTFRAFKQELKNNAEESEDSEEFTEEEQVEYDKYSKLYNGLNEQVKEEEEEIDMDKKPYVISPEEFDEIEEYEKVSLTYYSGDNVLAESISDEMIEEEDIEDIVGSDFASHFGEYEDDSVFVRNDKRCIDYEILMDERCYQDVVDKKFSYVANQDYE